MRKMFKNSMMISSAARALGIRLTEAERRAGRLLRAPDHDASSDAGAGDGGAGNADGGSGDNGGAGASSDPGAGAGDGAADSQGGAASGGDAGADGGADNSGAGGDAGGGEGKTILGGALDDGDGSGDDGAGQSEGETRLQFGEGEAAKPILGAPEAYAIELPEELTKAGMTFDKEAFDAVEPILRDLNLSNEAASALTSAYAEKILPLLQQRAGAANDALGADMRRQWSEAASKEFDGREGRAQFSEVKALCRQAFIRGGVDAESPFLTLLEESGLGSHPDMIRTMAYFGRALGEAGIEVGGGGPAPKRLADKIYGQPVPRE